MKIDLSRSDLTVYRNRPLRLEHARGQVIRCLGGTVWITQPEHREDVFLADGEELGVESDGLVLVEGVGGTAALKRS